MTIFSADDEVWPPGNATSCTGFPQALSLGPAMMNVILSAAMIVVFALFYGAIRLGLRDGFGQRPLLMIVAALVIAGNVVIWAVPDDQGRSLLNAASQDNAKGALE